MTRPGNPGRVFLFYTLPNMNSIKKISVIRIINNFKINGSMNCGFKIV